MKTLLATFLFLTACGGAAAPIDPTGHYTVAVLYQAGNCGLSGVDPAGDAFYVGDGHIVYDNFTPLQQETTVECDPDSCTFSGQVSMQGTLADGTPYTGLQTFSYTTAPGSSASGGGTLNVSSSAGGCQQDYLVTTITYTP